MAIVEVTVVPLGTGSPSVSEYVAACESVLRQETRVKSMLTPMSTILEGELDVILELIRKVHEVPFEKGALRVSTTIRIDERRDKKSSMEQKLHSVNEKIGG